MSQSDGDDAAMQRFFTVGLALQLEPLPRLSYDVVSRSPDEPDTDTTMDVGQGQRLKPRMTSFAPHTLAQARQFLSDPRVRECVDAWTKVLLLLDRADSDPHFSMLRHFFDARLPTLLDLTRADGDVDEMDEEVSPMTERKMSFRSGSRLPIKLPWPRISGTAAGESSTGFRSRQGSMRLAGGARRSEVELSIFDRFDLYVDAQEHRRVRFNVRLDLDRVHLANPRHTRADAEPKPADAPDEDDTTASSVPSRRSFVQRLWDRGMGRGSQASNPPPPQWCPNQDEMTLAMSQAIDDSDAELNEYTQGSPGRSHTRAGSMRGPASRPQLHLGKAIDAAHQQEAGQAHERVLSSLMHFGVGDSPVSSMVRENEDLLSLLRCASAYGCQVPSGLFGEQDPLPIIICLAFADAFGWEGLMHLCYGKQSACEREQVYAALGRAADMEMHRQEKHDAVLSWLGNISYESEDMNQVQAPPPDAKGDDDEIGSIPTRRSSEEFAPPHENARPMLSRTWEDWTLLFSSLSSWVSEYETTRVRACLAHEMGQEPTYQTAPSDKNAYIPYSVERDAVQGAFGFWRLSGIPGALRLESYAEHMDYRWARTRLESSQIGTPMVMSTSGTQFALLQLSHAPWVYNSAWELVYLDECILHSSIMRERFPPPGEAVAPALGGAALTQPERATACPYPSPHGAWNPQAWCEWLGTLREGKMIVPAVSWQGWWTLLAVLNGADHSGRDFDLQVRAPGDPVHPDELGSIYL